MIQEEGQVWRAARTSAYNYMLADALSRLGHEVTVVNPFFVRHLPELFPRPGSFDQVWVHLNLTSPVDNRWESWIKELSPVRLGYLGESYHYTPQELADLPNMGLIAGYFERRAPFLTHCLAVDETDVAAFNQRGLPSMWFVPCAPAGPLAQLAQVTADESSYAFMGSLYGIRKRFISTPELAALVTARPSSEAGTSVPALFDALHLLTRVASRRFWPGLPATLKIYNKLCRNIRLRALRLWYESLARTGAVVNLPFVVKNLPGRVFEAMAVSSPVLSWLPANRPLCEALFENGREALLFREPEELVDQIERLRREPGLRRRLAEAGKAKTLRLHTDERRVREILDWLESGRLPDYHRL